MPVIFGFNIPAFKFLDILSLEFEYHKRRFRNTTFAPDQDVLPQWALGETDMAFDDAQEWLKHEKGTADSADVEKWGKYHGDPHWWWSLYAKKTIMPGFRIHLQAARDHFRAIGSTLASSFEPILHRKKDWYWAVKLEFGL
jgi:hypothetical protein